MTLLITLFVALGVFAQERTVTKTLGDGKYYYKYTGTAADTLKLTNQDTIDFVFVYTEVEFVKKIAIHIEMDTIGGADSVVNFSLYGKEFEDDGTYVQIIAAANSSAVASTLHHIITSDYTETTASYLSAVPNFNALQDTATFSTYPADSIKFKAFNITNAAQTVTPLDKTYRYYRLRAIYPGDYTGDGIEIQKVEFKVYID